MHARPKHARNLDVVTLDWLAKERRLIEAIFASLAEEVERLRTQNSLVRRARFFSEVTRVIDAAIAARIPLATLEDRLASLHRGYNLPEDSPRFKTLEATVTSLATDSLCLLAERMAAGQMAPPVGSDLRLRAWAAVLETPHLPDRPKCAAAAKILREAAAALPQLPEFA